MLANRGRDLSKIALCCAICRRLNLERVGSIGLLFEVELGSHVFHGVHWVIDLKVLQGDLLALLMLVFR